MSIVKRAARLPTEPASLPRTTSLTVAEMTAGDAELRTEIVSDFGRLSTLAHDWERLRLSGHRPDVFMSFPFARAGWRAYAENRQLHAVAIFGGDRLVGLLPLVAEGTTLRFIASPECDYNDLLSASEAAPNVLSAAIAALFISPLPWDRCLLEGVPSDSNLQHGLERLSPNWQAHVVRAATADCPTLLLVNDRETQLQAILDNSRNRQVINRLRRKGALSFRHLDDREEVRQHLPFFFKQHIQRWALAGVESQFLNPGRRSFFETLVDEIDTDVLKFSVLSLDTRPIAYHLGFEFRGKFTFYKPTFDPDFWDDSPGIVLLLHLIDHVRRSELRELDFANGGEWYKSRFTNAVRHTSGFVLQRSLARATAHRVTLAAKDRLEAWPKLDCFFRAIAVAARRMHSLIRRKGLPSGLITLTRHCRQLILARDTVLIYTLDRLAAPVDASAPVGNVVLHLGTLSDLADIAARWQQDFGVDRLRRARNRLKRGDRLFLSVVQRELAHVAWLGVRNEIKAEAELGEQCSLSMGQVAVIFDCWTRPDFRDQGIYTATIQQLAALALLEHQRVVIFCRTTNTASRRGIEKAGFELKHKMWRVRLFRRFAWTRAR
ncbi:GNAT family N-acetyltransferase [Rhizobium sp. BK251]|uniref:GNAT family N-acetyltransferase n=1 Tax=Rhizobium sp. BK251 TaxID=2512125 RepID=UPI00104815C2|nr:GNAT family N-acetyltransferase [Rhizobium sp. BK251]TCL66365.1 CelD/BcsL family acetyltransferase involved in cellulose biosynthesis [Rhizobium sp. BK251]